VKTQTQSVIGWRWACLSIASAPPLPSGPFWRKARSASTTPPSPATLRSLRDRCSKRLRRPQSVEQQGPRFARRRFARSLFETAGAARALEPGFHQLRLVALAHGAARARRPPMA
jgi:hypothetical protein